MVTESTQARTIKGRKSALACLAVILTVLAFRPFSHYILTWDVFGYYLYLPAALIHHDLFLNDITWVHEAINSYRNTPALYQVVQSDNGLVMRYPLGMALLYLPFFFLGHAMALMMDYPADGFSAPYNVCMNFGSLVFVVAGLALLRKYLLTRFRDEIVALAVLLIGLGTSLLHLFSETWGMPHLYLFTLYAALMLLSKKWHETGSRKAAFVIGLVVSLMMVCRPSDVVAILIPILWGLRDMHFAKSYTLVLWVKLKEHGLLIMAGGVLPLSLQLCYWWAASGSPLFDSYTNPAEGLDFFRSHILDYLFSFRKGWLVYTPLALLIFIGIARMLMKKEETAIATFFYTVSTLYLLSCWSCWWYGDSFSQRSIGQSYAVFAIPIAFLVEGLMQIPKRWQYVSWVGIFAAVALNLFQTWQVGEGIIHTSRMTKEAYWMAFGKTEKPEHMDEALIVDRSNSVLDEARYERVKTFIVLDQAQHLTFPDKSFSQKGSWPFHRITEKDHAWLKISVQIEPTNNQNSLLVCCFTHQGETCHYRAFEINADTTNDSDTEMTFTYLTPELRSQDDEFVTYVWVSDSGSVTVKNLKVDVLERKSN